MRIAIMMLAVLVLAACHQQAPANTPGDATAASSDFGAEPAQGDTSLDGTPYANRPRAQPLSNKRSPAQTASKSESSAPVLEISSEFENYKHGKLDVPAYPGDLLYLAVSVQSPAGNPMPNLPVQVHSQRGNSSVLMADRTDKDGYLEFHVIADQMGEDLVTVSAAGVQRDFYISVTPPTRNEWLGGLNLKGVTPWELLMSAHVIVSRDSVTASFPLLLKAFDKKTVRLVGFMLPLGINEQQSHFLLSANPPSCFFHPPGGPSTAVDVIAAKPVEMSDEPLIVEGTLEMIERSSDGVIYRLGNAHKV